MENTNLILTSLDTMTMFDKENKVMFVLDELQNVSIQNNEETTDITGASGRKLDTLKQGKTVVITGANGLLSGPMMAVQTGGEYVSEESYPVGWTEKIDIDDPSNVRTTYKAVGLPGMEIRTILREGVGGTIDVVNQMKQGSEPSLGVFTYDPDTKLIQFADGELMSGDTIRVYYTRNVPATHVANPAGEFSKTGMVIIDCSSKDLCDNYYRSQLIIPRADFTGNFTLDIGNNEQAVHNFEINALASVSKCDTTGTKQRNIYWEFITFGKDAEDAD